ncbi:ATP-binding protein [Streptomyces sp. NPDC051642]|uniref:ATP-binding protein n=1 Tax=Streptomyces sp. NPDC051642 TaxID=3154646 RepID=UPI003441E65B
MNTMSVDVTTVRSATSVAGARDSARTFLDGLDHPIAAEAADSIEVAVHDHSPQAPRMRTPDLNNGTGGFGWPMVNRLAQTTAVTHQATGGKTVTALLTR